MFGAKSELYKLLGFKGTRLYVVLKSDRSVIEANNVEINERRVYYTPLRAVDPVLVEEVLTR